MGQYKILTFKDTLQIRFRHHHIQKRFQIDASKVTVSDSKIAALRNKSFRG